MLRASRRLLRAGGRTAYFSIHPVPGLADPLYRRALRAGPRAVATRRRTPGELMRAAGFAEVEVNDVTREFRDTLRRWIELWDRFARPLRSLHGDEEFRCIQAERRATLAAIDEGLLARSMVAGTR